ncbi:MULTISPECIES: hypothetical protein [unclassified Gordonia (in: high G+C Gram-positive bacteria)]|uniref:hypothetical protein n=1 Tax=unclassified Gordonia (in: high G+C Gram-positive bacteria) TaxID=2657482 RepID=UPI0007EACD6D|nr:MULTISPECIES: hypothetical protein [unclassified Gordonia (in: high G+C Gram-positive bacteria)]OBB99612.1 hypothetical protein A5785_19730 [Gordonia sp. 852002-50395_SCH5434458]OBC13915.1 hypothetical protein A5788_18650 [Gordonia sp. 852002-50816_SCH5313054-c]OBC16223.1 hypothetical protein A5786_20835 [Gordonia sp. 852002-50816_SCH5313054-a]
MHAVVPLSSPAPNIAGPLDPIVVPDATSDATMVVASPTIVPDLWRQYLDGAHAAYSARGVDDALDYDAISDGSSTTLFCAVLDTAGDIVGGLRVQGPYTLPHQSHAVTEWDGQPGQSELIRAIGARLAGGLIEVKSAFVDPTSSDAAAAAGFLARTPLIVMAATGTRHMLATAADYVLARWESGGGRVDTDIPYTPYPDERYRTQAMFWDRDLLARHAKPSVWRTMCTEFRQISHTFDAGSVDVA